MMWFFIRLFLLPLKWALKILAPLSLLAVAGLVGYLFFWLPDVSILADKNPETTAFMELTRERFQRTGNQDRVKYTWVDLEKISPALVEAVLIAEDDRFFLHKGFDFTEMANALETNLEAKRFVRGGSTISQQLVKNLYLSPEKSYTRKVNEALLTWKLEHTLSKERILELYLNVAEWGDGIFGAEQAAIHYFTLPAADLNESQAVMLAARLPNPHAKGSPTQRRVARENIILERLKKSRPGYRGAKRTLLAMHQPDKSGSESSWWESRPMEKLGEIAEEQFDTLWDKFSGQAEIVWDVPEKPRSTESPRRPVESRTLPTLAEPHRNPQPAPDPPTVRRQEPQVDRREELARERQRRIVEKIERLERPKPVAEPTHQPVPIESTPSPVPKRPNALSKDVHERLARLEKLLSNKD